ncbi:hypothetical protein T484DRAFT_2771600 [Baffinella frigidus]|nr:hypothetical protein T484DRAFT_2771600 [Cryptophyta sp. CCMP2293]
MLCQAHNLIIQVRNLRPSQAFVPSPAEPTTHHCISPPIYTHLRRPPPTLYPLSGHADKFDRQEVLGRS